MIELIFNLSCRLIVETISCQLAQKHKDKEIQRKKGIDIQRQRDRNTIINNKYTDTDLNRKLKFK